MWLQFFFLNLNYNEVWQTCGRVSYAVGERNGTTAGRWCVMVVWCVREAVDS